MAFRAGASLAILALLALSIPAAAIEAPKVSIDSLSKLTVPPHPYDETANASAVVDAAFAKARAEHKRVLIDLGGNWCPDCRILAGMMELPEMRSFLEAHYVLVSVDVGRVNKNLQVPAKFGITQRLEGVPSVLVADPDGKLLDAGHVAALADARSMTPQGIADWLAQWAQ